MPQSGLAKCRNKHETDDTKQHWKRSIPQFCQPESSHKNVTYGNMVWNRPTAHSMHNRCIYTSM
jgi:hypothetical protein